MAESNKQNGYSILELIVYISIFSLISIVLINSLITTMKTYARASSYRALQTNGDLVMERVSREIRKGTSVTSSACDSTPGNLTITSTDEDNTTNTHTFSVENGKLVLSVNGGTVEQISTDEIVINHLDFCKFTARNSTGVKIKLVLETTGGHKVSSTFYNSILLREIGS